MLYPPISVTCKITCNPSRHENNIYGFVFQFSLYIAYSYASRIHIEFREPTKILSPFQQGNRQREKHDKFLRHDTFTPKRNSLAANACVKCS